MKVKDSFLRFIQRMNESATGRNQAVNKSKFAESFNKNYISVIREYLDSKDSDKIDMIKELLVPNRELLKTINDKDFDVFQLPKDYIEYDHLTTTATQGGCTSKITVFPIKGRNTNSILEDEYNKPSFFYREAPFKIISDTVRIYKDGFSIDVVKLDYYKYPQGIQLLSPTDPESDFINIDFEVTDAIINEVIDKTVLEYSLSIEDYNKFSAEATNINNNKVKN